MCYSAMVNQEVKKLGLRYKARIQIDMFDDLFKFRNEGSGAKIPIAMENAFLEKPASAVELRIAKNIRQWRNLEAAKMEEELSVQIKRLSVAEKSLLGKVTKKAQNDQRISSEKIKKLTHRLERIQSSEAFESDSRIYPGNYAPLILNVADERVIQPFRYLLRPKGQSAEYDRKFNGAYNARRDRLKEVFWWKSVFGRNHGVMEISAFYENVKKHDFENRKLLTGEEEQNLILKFEPEAHSEMLVPCIWDHNEEDEFTLDSFALITDEPNPEVAAVGHDRTPIIMRPEYLDLWLRTAGQELDKYERVFDDKQSTYFEHEIAA